MFTTKEAEKGVKCGEVGARKINLQPSEGVIIVLPRHLLTCIVGKSFLLEFEFRRGPDLSSSPPLLEDLRILALESSETVL